MRELFFCLHSHYYLGINLPMKLGALGWKYIHVDSIRSNQCFTIFGNYC